MTGGPAGQLGELLTDALGRYTVVEWAKGGRRPRADRDLSAYRIRPVLEADGWHVDYDRKDPRLKGGGPHYVIDAHDGSIRSKRYGQ